MIFFVNGISAQNPNWKGIYTFDEESEDMDGKWSSRWFRLEVKEINGKLAGIYSDGENTKTYQNFSLTVVVLKDTAAFYFDKDLITVNLPGSDGGEFQKGELVFKLKSSFDKNKKPIMETIWGKINLGARSETGGFSEENIFFRRVPD